jgi:DNA-directed RNA polymerase subunit RPC12/RpoP
MIIIKCANCGREIFRYQKIGKGKLLHCWKNRISRDYSIKATNEVRCKCGNLMGWDEGRWIKLKQGSFTCSGSKLGK